MRLIDADDFKKRIYDEFEVCDELTIGEFVQLLNDISTIEERPKGKWIYEYVEDMGVKILVCSECHYPIGQIRDCFCANCGARMESDV